MNVLVSREACLPRFVWCAILAFIIGASADASIVIAPDPVNVIAGQASPPVSLAATFVPPVPSNVGVLFSGLPAGATTNPAGIILTVPVGGAGANTVFTIVTTAATSPGSYPVTVQLIPDGGAGTTTFTLVVTSPSFEATISPRPVSLPWGGSQNVTVATVPSGGFSANVTYSFSGFPAGISTGAPQIASPPYAPLTFTFAVAPRTPPGTYNGTLFAQWVAGGAQTRTFPMSVVVQPPRIIASFSPSSLTVYQNGVEVPAILTLSPDNGYQGTPLVSWSATPASLQVTPAVLPSSPLPPAQSTNVGVRAVAAAPGLQSVVVHVVDAGAAVDTTATLLVGIGDASISVAPSPVTLQAGGRANVTVTANGTNGFAGTLSVQSPVIAGVSLSPPSFTLHAGESRTVTLDAAPSAVPGATSGNFTATSAELSGVRTAPLSVIVTQPIPEITRAIPPGLTVATVGTVVRLTGLNFRPGAVVTFTPAGPVVTSTSVFSATLAEIVVNIPAGTQVGSYRVDLRNTDGTSTVNGIEMIVSPASSVGAALGVSTAAIVFPRPYASVAPDEPVFPRGVLATTGLGTITGTWQLDGIPFDQFVVAASGGLPVEVTSRVPVPFTAVGEHRLELVVEQPQRLTTRPVPVIMSLESHSGLHVLTPDRTVASDESPLRWSLVPGASGYEIEIEGVRGASRILRLSRSEWRPDGRAIKELGRGIHRFRVAAVYPGGVRGRATEWHSFSVGSETKKSAGDGAIRLASVQETPAEAIASTPEAVAGKKSDWNFAMSGVAGDTQEKNHDGGDAARLQLTSQSDVANGSFGLKETIDFSGRRDLDPTYGSGMENRAWQVQLAGLHPRFGQELHAGYSPPEFLDQSEFLAAGLARGGALAKQSTPFGSISYYDTFYDDASGAVSAYDLNQRLTGAAWQAPLDPNRGTFRVFGLRSKSGGTEEPGDESKSEALGMFGQFVVNESLSLVIEAARGSLEQGFASTVEGNGFRLGAMGTKGTWTYGVNLRKTDSGLANPANIGLTPGSIPDRAGGDLTIGKTFGARMLTVQYRRLQDGDLAGGGGAHAVEESAGFTFMSPFGSKVMLMANSSLTTTRSDGQPEQFLSAADRSLVVAGATLSETLGTISLSQALTWQDLADKENPAFDSTVSSASFSATRAAGWIALTALLSGTRTESPQPAGMIDNWLASLQPTFTWQVTGLSFTPAFSYSKSDSELAGASTTEQYRTILQWTPKWLNSFVGIQIAGNWSRFGSDAFPAGSFHQEVIGNITLRWGLGHAAQSDATQQVPSMPVAMLSARNMIAR